MTSYVLRPGKPSDADALVRLWHAGWHDAHRGHVPDAMCETRDRSHFAKRVADLPWASSVVAAQADVVVGFALVRDAQLDQIYVAAEGRGNGAGALLLASAESAIRAAGFEEAWLMVAAGNRAARRFYQRHGWSDGGPQNITVDGVRASAHRYDKRLPP